MENPKFTVTLELNQSEVALIIAEHVLVGNDQRAIDLMDQVTNQLYQQQSKPKSKSKIIPFPTFSQN